MSLYEACNIIAPSHESSIIQRKRNCVLWVEQRKLDKDKNRSMSMEVAETTIK